MTLPIFKTTAELRAYLLPWRRGRIALVPTMGALHAGHLELVRRAHAIADHVVVYIFVNPLQFAPHEDFTAYPRDLQKDVKAVAALGFENISIFTPTVTEVYPGTDATQIMLGDIATRWEGAARPTHFAGVALVLSKFFNLVQPNAVCFGEKDFQQLQVVRQLVRDLVFPIEVIGVETLREASGLAMSSRNAYLNANDRLIAPKLFAALHTAAGEILNGGDAATITAHYSHVLLDAGFAAIDYFVCVDAVTLAPHMHGQVPKNSRILAAARLGKVRLLDNIAIN